MWTRDDADNDAVIAVSRMPARSGNVPKIFWESVWTILIATPVARPGPGSGLDFGFGVSSFLVMFFKTVMVNRLLVFERRYVYRFDKRFKEKSKVERHTYFQRIIENPPKSPYFYAHGRYVTNDIEIRGSFNSISTQGLRLKFAFSENGIRRFNYA